MSAGTLDREKLAALLGMLGSAFAGERDNAARLADRLVRDAGLTWQQILDKPPALPAPPPREPVDIRRYIALCRQNPAALTGWEVSFVEDIARQEFLSAKQLAVLEKCARKAMEASKRPPPAPATKRKSRRGRRRAA